VPGASPNSTKMRFVCGKNGTLPLAVANSARVGMALVLIVVVTVEPIDEMQWFMGQLPRLRLHRTRLLGGARQFSGK
jgi:hypothetical protein